jgi:phage gpG-like protein
MSTVFVDISQLLTQIDTNAQNLDFTEPLDLVADDLVTTHEDYFNAQADPNGLSWKPLSPRTVKKKGHPIILIETNAMRSSLVNRERGDHVEAITKDSLAWGTRDPKAGFHQDGTERIPQRQFVGWNEPAIVSASERIADAAVLQLLAGIGVP